MEENEIGKLAVDFIVENDWNVFEGQNLTKEKLDAETESYARMKKCFIAGYQASEKSHQEIAQRFDVWKAEKGWTFIPERNLYRYYDGIGNALLTSFSELFTLAQREGVFDNLK